jgi:hypothetical protein
VNALAALRRDPPVARIEAMLSKAESRIALLTTKADEIDGGEDPAAVVAAETAVATAVAERLVLEKALAAAQKAAKAEAVAEKARLAEERRRKLLARAEDLQPKLLDALENVARLMGLNQSIADALLGPEAMRFWIGATVEEASKRACRDVKPKTMPTETVSGTKYTLVTNPMVRVLDLQFQVPLVDVD